MPSPIAKAARFTTALLWAAVAIDCHAAGGHFDVDDATIVDPQHCQLETWWLRSPAESTHAAHLGGACRGGPLEWGLNLDRTGVAGSSATALGPQAKWVADPLVDRLSAGLVWAIAIDAQGRSAPAHTVYVPLTLWSGERVQLHLNSGVDWVAGGTGTHRWGAAAEWAVSDRLSLLAERSLITQVWTSRVGTRLNLTPSLSLDCSVARRSTTGHASYALGLNRDFDLH